MFWLVFLCFAPGIWELRGVLALLQRWISAVGFAVGFGVGLGSFWLLRAGVGWGRLPLSCSPGVVTNPVGEGQELPGQPWGG